MCKKVKVRIYLTNLGEYVQFLGNLLSKSISQLKWKAHFLILREKYIFKEKLKTFQ